MRGAGRRQLPAGRPATPRARPPPGPVSGLLCPALPNRPPAGNQSTWGSPNAFVLRDGGTAHPIPFSVARSSRGGATRPRAFSQDASMRKCAVAVRMLSGVLDRRRGSREFEDAAPHSEKRMAVDSTLSNASIALQYCIAIDDLKELEAYRHIVHSLGHSFQWSWVIWRLCILRFIIKTKQKGKRKNFRGGILRCTPPTALAQLAGNFRLIETTRPPGGWPLRSGLAFFSPLTPLVLRVSGALSGAKRGLLRSEPRRTSAARAARAPGCPMSRWRPGSAAAQIRVGPRQTVASQAPR